MRRDLHCDGPLYLGHPALPVVRNHQGAGPAPLRYLGLTCCIILFMSYFLDYIFYALLFVLMRSRAKGGQVVLCCVWSCVCACVCARVQPLLAQAGLAAAGKPPFSLHPTPPSTHPQRGEPRSSENYILGAKYSSPASAQCGSFSQTLELTPEFWT